MENADRIEELLDEAYNTEDPEEMERLARQVLKQDGENVEALILLADVTDLPDEKISLLEKARQLLEESLESDPLPEDAPFLDDDEGMLYVAVLQRLGFSYFSEGENEKALEIAQAIMEYDPDQQTLGRTLFYRVLLEMKEYGRILEESLKEQGGSPAMLHSRAIAAFKLSGPGMPAYRALWEAFAADPEVPFYILGYYEEPGDDVEEEQESFSLALLFEDAWLAADNDTSLPNWLARATILFGLSASLFPPENTEKMMILADALDIADSVEEALVKLESREDWGMLSRAEKMRVSLKLLSEGKYLPLKQ